jgi:hypothetical protein
MTELERQLLAAAREIEWPATPRFDLPQGARPRRTRPLALVLVAAALAAIAVALAVPGARSAILRALHLEGVTIQRVDVLPPAEERPLAAGLGPPATAVDVRLALGRPARLPRIAGRPILHLQGEVVSVLFRDHGQPVLLSEFSTGAGPEILKKMVGGSTGVESVRVGTEPGVWISGAEHVYMAPEASPRLAGNVLLWESDGIAYRLEGRNLEEGDALRLAAQIEGT